MAVNKVMFGNQTLIDLSTDTVASSDDILAGKVGHLRDGSVVTGTASGGDQHGTIWQDGQGYVHLDDESGIALQSKTATPTESQQVIEADNGYYALDKVTVEAISSSYVGSGVTRRNSSDLTANGATVTAPAGYYSAQASKSVATGTAGTPTATKGTVSNHAVTVTPSVTNTAGYISGGTKTGTGVSVSASELVSGTYSVTSSGTKDVTNYASASVPAGTEGTPTATKGTVSNHSVSVTPSVTNTGGYISGTTKTGTAVTVSASELVSGTKTITENGTGIDVSTFASIDVNVSGSSSSSYELIASTTYVVNTSSTTAINVGTFETGDTSIWTSDKMVFIKIRDTAGRRNGYYYGTDAIICNNVPGNGLSSTASVLIYGTMYYQNTAGRLINMNLQRTQSTSSLTGYGIYPTTINNDGSISIQARYSTTGGINTQTINGTFKVDVYLLDWPGGVSPFNG